jgi:hypothetical protein
MDEQTNRYQPLGLITPIEPTESKRQINRIFPIAKEQTFYIANASVPMLHQYLNFGQGLHDQHHTMSHPAYIYDLHRIGSDMISLDYTYSPIMLKSFSVSASSVVKRTAHSFVVSPFTTMNSNALTHAGTIATHPLIAPKLKPEEEGETRIKFSGNHGTAEQMLYMISLYPGLPFIINSSAPTFEHYAPVFMKSFTIKAAGSGGIKAVDISIQFEGGKTVKMNNMPQATPKTVEDPENEFSKQYIPYRAANTMDCFVATYDNQRIDSTDVEYYDEIMKQAIKGEQNFPIFRVTGTSLAINQEFQFTATGNQTDSITKKLKYTEMFEGQGPKFAALKSRSVSGEIECFSPLTYAEVSDNLGILTNQTVIMYFGNGFLYVMPNCDFDPVSYNAAPDGGCMLTYKFTARAAPEAIRDYTFLPNSAYKSNSEFLLIDQLLESING